jgi:hypothetical protein
LDDIQMSIRGRRGTNFLILRHTFGRHQMSNSLQMTIQGGVGTKSYYSMDIRFGDAMEQHSNVQTRPHWH